MTEKVVIEAVILLDDSKKEKKASFNLPSMMVEHTFDKTGEMKISNDAEDIEWRKMVV